MPASLLLLAAVPTVVVTASRAPVPAFEVPAALSISEPAPAQANINLSEALTVVPGVMALNRQNYAQDLQVSIRGFGARSAFGVRGVRLLIDGIPATMPDGQGQAATFDLDVAERIEVLRGPFSVLYGNHGGGVVQLFTRRGKAPASVDATFAAGSDGLRKVGLTAQGDSYLLDASRMTTDGYRQHSAATREQGFARLDIGGVSLQASGLRQGDTQDPLGASWATWQRDPRAGEPDPSDPAGSTFADRYNTRKSISHQQVGAHFAAGSVQLTAWAGNRAVTQYQAFSRAFQSPPSHAGGVVDIARDFSGVDVQWQHKTGPVLLTTGLELAQSRDERRGFENFLGDQLGVQGRSRRDETDKVSSADPYAQAEWKLDDWRLSAGLRRNSLHVDVDDRYRSNGDDSGRLHYADWSPGLAALFHASPTLNLYASAGRGFETPTLNELFYARSGGFNFSLRPARSTQAELGAKWHSPGLQLEAALFQADSHDELAVDSASGGRTSYRNATATRRVGAELSLAAALSRNLFARAAATLLRAEYSEGFGSVAAGSRLPATPSASAAAELAWRSGPTAAAIELQAASRMFPDDANIETPAPGYGIANLRAETQLTMGAVSIRTYARLNNALGRRYIGSLIVGDTNKRFYEAAPGRNWLVGLQLSVPVQARSFR